MKRTVRVFCAAFAAALSLSLISGCKPGDATESGTSGSETKKNVTLTLASWEVNALKAPWMAKFTEKHPEIKVRIWPSWPRPIRCRTSSTSRIFTPLSKTTG